MSAPRTPHARIAGVDEAGRGPLAGPVLVAAGILDPANTPSGLDDSKRLSPRRRQQLYEQIKQSALSYRIEQISPQEIDQLNILQATLTGMRRALAGLRLRPDLAIIDGNQMPDGLDCTAQTLIGGDALEPAISAASILAKVARDHYMIELHAQFPQYGFDRHKGYPTPAHLAALQRHGPCPEHRRSFSPIKQGDLFAPAASNLPVPAN